MTPSREVQTPSLFSKLRILTSDPAKIDIRRTSKEEAIDHLCRFGCNNFSVWEEGLFPVGEGTFPFGSLLNHSCQPNSVLMYLGGKQVVRAMEPIGVGEEITISYVDTAHAMANRGRLLADKYFFTCRCPSCVDPLVQGCEQYTAGFLSTTQSHMDERNKKIEERRLSDLLFKDITWISERVSGGQLAFYEARQRWISEWSKANGVEEDALAPTGAEADEVMAERMKEFESLEKEGEQISFWVEQEWRWRKALKTRLQTLHPLHVGNIAPLNRLMQMYIDLSKWEDAAPFCRQVLLIYTFLYPPHHPLVGLQWFTLAKVLWNSYQADEAKLALRMAKECLLHTHSAPPNTPRYQSGVLQGIRFLEQQF